MIPQSWRRSVCEACPHLHTFGQRLGCMAGAVPALSKKARTIDLPPRLDAMAECPDARQREKGGWGK